jgi:hypothetical protein
MKADVYPAFTLRSVAISFNDLIIENLKRCPTNLNCIYTGNIPDKNQAKKLFAGFTAM